MYGDAPTSEAPAARRARRASSPAVSADRSSERSTRSGPDSPLATRSSSPTASPSSQSSRCTTLTPESESLAM